MIVRKVEPVNLFVASARPARDKVQPSQSVGAKCMARQQGGDNRPPLGRRRGSEQGVALQSERARRAA